MPDQIPAPLKRKIGRPTAYREEMCDLAIHLMAEGASKTEVMAKLDIGHDTFYKWIESNREFAEAIKIGSKLSEAWWEEQGRISLRDKNFNAVLWYMNMKNRFKWTDKQEQQVSIHIDPAEALEYLK